MASKKPAKKSATKKSATRRSATKKSATKKSATKKSATKKSATKKSATKKSATKKSATKKSATERPFTGFGPNALKFLKALDANNNRDWFMANKDRYEDEIREPARAFIRAMEKPLRAISKQLVADDSKVGGSLMRVHRDVRFRKDKTPYKTNVGIQFRHDVGKDVHAPGLYLHLGLDGCFLGMGMWHPDADALKGIRSHIAGKGKKWNKVVDAVQSKGWRQSGDSLKRAPKGYDPDHPHIELLRRKDHILVCDLTNKEAAGSDLVDQVMARAKTAKPHMALLCEAIGVAF